MNPIHAKFLKRSEATFYGTPSAPNSRGADPRERAFGRMIRGAAVAGLGLSVAVVTPALAADAPSIVPAPLRWAYAVGEFSGALGAPKPLPPRDAAPEPVSLPVRVVMELSRLTGYVVPLLTPIDGPDATRSAGARPKREGACLAADEGPGPICYFVDRDHEAALDWTAAIHTDEASVSAKAFYQDLSPRSQS